MTSATLSSEEATHIVRCGDTLWEICDRRYGCGHYAWAVGLYNEMTDPAKLVPGAHVDLPVIADLLAREPRLDELREPMQQLWSLRVRLSSFASELHTARVEAVRNRARVPVGEPAASVPDMVAARLLEEAEAVDGIADLIPDSSRRRRIVDQLELLGRNLRDTARGVQYGSGYDLDMIDIRCAWIIYQAMLGSEAEPDPD